jgi:hypothetical protein
MIIRFSIFILSIAVHHRGRGLVPIPGGHRLRLSNYSCSVGLRSDRDPVDLAIASSSRGVAWRGQETAAS